MVASRLAGNLFSAAKAWKAHVGAGRRADRVLPPETYLEVRYETLLGDPAATVNPLPARQFAGLRVYGPAPVNRGPR